MEPVLVTAAGLPNQRGEVDAFDKRSEAEGCLGLLRLTELMLNILNHFDRFALVGHHLGKRERSYIPETCELFKLTD